jgi:5'-methylthioadenosine phosphorylase
MDIKIGIIGGSGLDNPALFKNPQDRDMDTPWGKPSSPLKEGLLDGVSAVLLARHGRSHTIPPTQVNYRANIWALKELGCTHILASTAVGSLREEIGRGDLVLPDQFIDFTRSRKLSYFESFEPGKLCHTAMAEPFDAGLRKIMAEELTSLNYRFHKTGTVVTIEGPRFSTRAESRMFRIWGADIINMSIATEAIMANEQGIPYAAIAMSTDYDSWKDDDTVSWEAVLEVAQANARKVLELFRRVVPRIEKEYKNK